MRKRNIFLVGFSLGYLWRMSKSGRTAFMQGAKRGSKNALSDSITKYVNRVMFETTERDSSTGDKPVKVTVDTKEAAEFLIDRLNAILKQYGFVTRKDLRDLVGLPVPIKGGYLGWTTLEGVEIRSVEDKWTIHFPQPQGA